MSNKKPTKKTTAAERIDEAIYEMAKGLYDIKAIDATPIRSASSPHSTRLT